MLVVDTFNVLHVTGVLPPELAGLEVPDLVRLVAASRYAGQQATFVCDGARPGMGHGGPSAYAMGTARVLYPGVGRDADSEIEKLLELASFASRITVVSSDQRLRRAARRRGAVSLSSEKFLERLAEDHGRGGESDALPAFVHEIPLDRYSVAHWMAEFGLGAPDFKARDAAAERERRELETELSRLRSAYGSPASPEVASAPAAADPSEANASATGGVPADPRDADPRGKDSGGKESPAKKQTPDREIEGLLRESGESIDPDELDMGRWLGER